MLPEWANQKEQNEGNFHIPVSSAQEGGQVAKKGDKNSRSKKKLERLIKE